VTNRNATGKSAFTDFPFYPLLFAVFIPVNLLAQNISLFTPSQCIRAAALFLAAATVVELLTFLVLRQRDGAALLTTMLFAGIWAYQFSTVWRVVYVAVLVISAWVVWRGLCTRKFTTMANWVLLAIILQPAYVLVSNQWLLEGRDPVTLSYSPFAETRPIPGDGPLPVIVHILLDGYASSDVLSSVMSFDNSGFETELENMGFAVATDARTPYNRTLMVMPSIFGGTYLKPDEPPIAIVDINRAKLALGQIVTDGPLKRSLSVLGYKFLYTDLGLNFWRLGAEDIVSSPTLDMLNLSAYEQLLIERTPLKLIPRVLSRLTGKPGRWSTSFSALTRHSLATEFYLEHEAPYLLYEHVLAPHPPFNIDRHGNYTNDWPEFGGLADGADATSGDPRLQRAYIAGYLEKLRYLNKMLLAQVKIMIREIPSPKVIMIHGDHGGGAYYFPEGDPSQSCLYERYKPFLAVYSDDISIREAFAGIKSERINLVNLYRIIFDARFGTDIGNAPDRSWFTRWEMPQIELTDDDIEARCALLPAL
jgi:hypothetical protein